MDAISIAKSESVRKHQRAASLMVFISILALNLIIITTFTTLEAQAQGSCHLRELDLCAASMLVFTQAPNGLATSEAEINRQCLHLRDADSCLRNYTRRCMTPIQRELMTFAVNSSFTLLDEYCTKGSRLRQSYLKHATCLNQVQKKQEHKSCMHDLQVSLEMLTTNSSNGGKSAQSAAGKLDRREAPLAAGTSGEPTSKRLQLACCAYRRLESCLGGRLEKRCGKETVQFVQSTLRRATSRLPETVCRHFKPDGEECRALLPKSGSMPRGTKSNSIVSRLLSAYSSL